MGAMRLVRLLFFTLLFAAGEVAMPVAPAAESVEEASEETPHPSARRRSERQAAAARTPSPATAAVQAAHRPVGRVLTRNVELIHRASLRKIPPLSSASSSAPEEDH